MAQRYDSLQFVAFLSAPSAKSAVEIWQTRFGGAPEAFQQLPLGGSQCSGHLDALAITLQVQSNRIDLVVAARQSGDLASRTQIDDPGGAITLGRSMFEDVSRSEAVERPAVVFQASEECANAAEAAQKVVQRVPGLSCPPGTVDIQYQIIVPRQSRMDERTKLNRLVRWNTGRSVLMQVDLSGAANQQLPSIIIANQYVDVFAAQGVSLGADLFSSVSEEIVAEAQRILSIGYDALL